MGVINQLIARGPHLVPSFPNGSCFYRCPGTSWVPLLLGRCPSAASASVHPSPDSWERVYLLGCQHDVKKHRPMIFDSGMIPN